jgi:hypothetical protein
MRAVPLGGPAARRPGDGTSRRAARPRGARGARGMMIGTAKISGKELGFGLNELNNENVLKKIYFSM